MYMAKTYQLRRWHALVLESEVQARVLKRFNDKLEGQVARMGKSEQQKRAALRVLRQAMQQRSEGEQQEMERIHKEVIWWWEGEGEGCVCMRIHVG